MKGTEKIPIVYGPIVVDLWLLKGFYNYHILDENKQNKNANYYQLARKRC